MSDARRYVTVVSGLPRSGTSLAMQMLRAGGMPLLADGARPADTDNPAGYFEYAPVLRTATDASWVAWAPGRAVKVIYALLRHLPDGFAYRVLFLRRPLGEVIASQDAMLTRRGSPPDAQLPLERVAAVFAAQLAETHAWLAEQPSFAVLDVEYHGLLAAPDSAAAAIDHFLGDDLDRAAMAAAVDPALHRQRGP